MRTSPAGHGRNRRGSLAAMKRGVRNARTVAGDAPAGNGQKRRKYRRGEQTGEWAVRLSRICLQPLDDPADLLLSCRISYTESKPMRQCIAGLVGEGPQLKRAST
jgi:hypothetical protein